MYTARDEVESGRLPRRSRVLWTIAIVAFLAAQAALSLRSALLQDDRYGWRMFHNMAFYRVSYAWLDGEGVAHPYKPSEDDVVQRGRRWILVRKRWMPGWYSEGTLRAITDDYAREMGERRRPAWAHGFRARLELRINNAEEPVVHIYQYPADPLAPAGG